MTHAEKQIPKLINNKEYLFNFLNSRIRDIDPDGVKLLRLNSQAVKAHFDDKFFHYVIFNNLTFKNKQGLRKRCIVLCISFSGHGRLKMYQALELVYQNGFSKGSVIVPQPLWYSRELMAAFYKGIPGDNLLEHIKNGYLNLNTIKKIASGLSRLHNIKKPRSLKLKKHNFSPIFLDSSNVINRPHNLDTQLAWDVLEQFKKLKKAKKKLIKKESYVFSHGDFHPENIIVNKFDNNQLTIIDFSEVCLAPVYYDIASFLQQLGFMAESYLSPQEHQEIEYIFLTTYFNRKTIDKDIQERINLYKSWTALKSTVYFMIFEDKINRNFAEHLLTQSEDFYRQIKF
jgi:thiamine kinase-like enzyme